MVLRDKAIVEEGDTTKFNVIVLMSEKWRGDEKNRQELLQMVKDGKGLVVVHMAYGPCVEALGGKATRNGKTGEFKVEVVDKNHPITQGMDNFMAGPKDELYAGVKFTADDVHVLARGQDTLGTWEPVAWVRTFGKGRIFYTSLGHSTDSQKNPNFIKLVSSGVRWVAEKREPTLPEKDGAVSIQAQEWPLKPGPREIKIAIHYPGGSLKNVNASTGLMLSLHNWGGSGCAGTADPVALANRYNVIALCVDYLQSGKQASIDDPEPYDFGYLQALDALRALHFAFDVLQQRKQPFASGRIYATGGSGGGNVTLMANKLAPRTFAAIIDMCGMARLTDDIAFNLQGGSDLNARYSRDTKSPNYLNPDAQQLRFVGHPEHLKVMKQLQTACKIIVVHGAEDRTCPIEDAREMVGNMKAAGLDVEAHFITKEHLDGKAFTSTGHALGNRTQIVFRVADKYLLPDSPDALMRKGPTDFERRDAEVRYGTPGGAFVISYEKGLPVGVFAPKK